MSSEEKIKILFGRHPDWEPQMTRIFNKEKFDCKFVSFWDADFGQADAVVPLRLVDAELLQFRRTEAAGKAFCPASAAIALADDKYQFNEKLLASEFRQYIPPHLDGTDGELPFILKKKHDEFGENSFLIQTEDDRLKHKDRIASAEYFCQAYIKGDQECATHVFYVGGKVKYHLNVIYHMGQTYYVKGRGNLQKTFTENSDTKYLDIFGGILDLIGFGSGICCFNYKMVGDVPMIFELNPRFGGSLQASVNHFLDAYLLALDEDAGYAVGGKYVVYPAAAPAAKSPAPAAGPVAEAAPPPAADPVLSPDEPSAEEPVAAEKPVSESDLPPVPEPVAALDEPLAEEPVSAEKPVDAETE